MDCIDWPTGCLGMLSHPFNPSITLTHKHTHTHELSPAGTLLVNVASYCALTPQYPALEALYEQFHDQGLEVIGVGCNQFGGQEPEKMEKVGGFEDVWWVLCVGG